MKTPTKDIVNLLKEAQDILSDVYHWACENGVEDVERLMSVADGCIIDAIDVCE
jgi:hypothetical protein